MESVIYSNVVVGHKSRSKSRNVLWFSDDSDGKVADIRFVDLCRWPVAPHGNRNFSSRICLNNTLMLNIVFLHVCLEFWKVNIDPKPV